jgi:hypothetical protein
MNVPAGFLRADVTGLRGTLRIDNPPDNLKVFSTNYQAFPIDNHLTSIYSVYHE